MPQSCRPNKDLEESCIIDPVNNAIMDQMVPREVKALLRCLRDTDHSHITWDLLYNLPAVEENERHPILPPDGSCDFIMEACEDKPMYRESYNGIVAEAWTDEEGKGCSDYCDNSDSSIVEMVGAKEHCCNCGGGRPCVDMPGWKDRNGKGCASVRRNDDMCNASAWENDDANDDDNVSYAFDGITALEACCGCGARQVAPMTPQRVDLPLPDWAIRCPPESPEMYEMNCECNEDAPSDDPCWQYHYNWDIRAACASCGGGFWDVSPMPEKAAAWMLASWEAAERKKCASEEGIDMCQYTCATCLASGSWTNQEIATLSVIQQCSDLPYQDWLGEECSWYFYNDDDMCSKYATHETLEACQKTCGTCPYAEYLLSHFDSDESRARGVDVTEYNTMMHVFGTPPVPFKLWEMEVKKLCQQFTWAGQTDCLTANYPILNSTLFHTPKPPGPNTEMHPAVAQLMAVLNDYMGAGVPYLPEDRADMVQRFGSELILDGMDDLSLTAETFATTFPSCTNHSDCEGLLASACGDVNAPGLVCSRRYVMPMYCSPMCHTGGCERGGEAMPNATGPFCQPCDACWSLESAAGTGSTASVGQPCPSWCQGYDVDADGKFDKMIEAAVLPPADRPGGTQLDHLDGSFTLAAWVRSFDTQWLFEKRIHLPGLNLAQHEGYDNETQSLTCWQMNPSEVRFRNRWDEKAMTVLRNPLYSKVQASPDTWHHVVFRKMTSWENNAMMEHVAWLVDGEVSTPPVDAFNEPVVEVPPGGFRDCGGEIRFASKESRDRREGPDDFYKEPWIGMEWLNAQNRTLPLNSGLHGKTVLSFSGVNVPPKATISSAYLMICAARTFIDYALDEECGYKEDMLINMKIAGLKATEESIYNQRAASSCFLSSLATGDSLTGNETLWSVNLSTWREAAIVQDIGLDFQQLPPPPDANHDCYVQSTDLKDLVVEMLGAELPDSDNGRELHFVVADVRKPWDECGNTSLWEDRDEYEEKLNESSSAAATTCMMLKYRGDFFQKHLPLWMVPSGDTVTNGRKKTQLVIQYCLNEQCVSPSFLGGGPSAKDTVYFGPDGGARRLEDAAKSPVQPNQPLPPAAAAVPQAAARPRVAARPNTAARPTLAAWPKAGARPRPNAAAAASSASAAAAASPVQSPPHARRVAVAAPLAPKKRAPAQAPPQVQPRASPQAPQARQRRMQNSTPDESDGASAASKVEACAGGTCLLAGSIKETGLGTPGLMMWPTFEYVALSDSEVQQAYYEGMPLMRPKNQDELSGPEPLVRAPGVEVYDYTKEVVSIIPPVVFQRRSELVDCKEHVPQIADVLEQYFVNQISDRCDSSYSCTAKSGFSCIERERKTSPDEPFFGTKTIEFLDDYWYPEFVDMFTLPTIFRNGAMVEPRDWVDLQTSTVKIYNIFLTPSLHSGTLVSVTWSYTGAGRIRGSTEVKSFVEMPAYRYEQWSVLVQVVIVLAAVDLFFVFCTVAYRWRHRLITIAAVPAMTDEQKETLEQALPVATSVDAYDIMLRVVNIWFCAWHMSMCSRDDSGRTDYEQVIADILGLEWTDPSQTTDVKVNKFMNLVVNLNAMVAADVDHRMYAKLLVLLFFIRAVVYMRVHPRIAILYATLVDMCMDFIHFLLLFSIIFIVLCFLGTWSFGDDSEDFRDMATTSYTQFRLICGEFNLPTAGDAGFTPGYGVYCILYFLLVFSLLMNFFLAIVVDCYASVKEKIKKCEVENNVVWDVVFAFAYPILRLLRGWPGRSAMLQKLVRLDVNSDGRNDEAQDEVAFGPRHLVAAEAVRSEGAAKALFRYYKYVCPAVSSRWKEPTTKLEHTSILNEILAIDDILHQHRGELKVDEDGKAPVEVLTESQTGLEREVSQLKEKIDMLPASYQSTLQEVIGGSSASSGAASPSGYPQAAYQQMMNDAEQLRRKMEALLSAAQETKQYNDSAEHRRDASAELQRSRTKYHEITQFLDDLAAGRHVPSGSASSPGPS